MAQNKDYYDILRVAKNASQSDIKKAYKKAVIKWHPDKFATKSEEERKEAELKMQEINEANEVLSDPDKRAHYDQFGSMDGFGQGGMDVDMDDFFSHFGNPFGFGFGHHEHRNTGPEPGETINVRVDISIEELFSGIDRDITYNIHTRCNTCNGEGYRHSETCPHCHGTGMITQRQQFGPGQFMQTSSPCPHCHGTGKIQSDPCSSCGGKGYHVTNKTIHLNIPAGVQQGAHYRYSGCGYESLDKNGTNGDAIVTIVYNFDNRRYNVQNGIVYELVNLPYYDFIVGTTNTITLPNKKVVSYTVKPYSQDNTQIILKGEGLNGNDYILVLHPTLPTYVNSKVIDLLKDVKKNS